jgi:hypothetical protein
MGSKSSKSTPHEYRIDIDDLDQSAIGDVHVFHRYLKGALLWHHFIVFDRM